MKHLFPQPFHKKWGKSDTEPFDAREVLLLEETL